MEISVTTRKNLKNATLEKSPDYLRRGFFLFALRGYVPDACGITSHGRRVNWGDAVKIDDDLVLWLTKPLS
jgi:hypothetical protein